MLELERGMNYMKTKELEKELGLTKHTIRYYEDEGFIHPKRDANGYRDYSEEDVQVLQLVKFLRNLNISIDDIKAFINGRTSFEECLRISQANLEHQIEGLKEINQQVQKFKDKNLPILPALNEIEETKSNWKLGFQKTTNTISLGRKLTKAWCRRQMLYALGAAIMFGYASIIFTSDLSMILRVLIFIIVAMLVELLFLASAFRETTTLMLDMSMDQSIEFLRDGIRYYKFNGFISNLKYFFAVLKDKDDSLMHYYKYEDIESIKIVLNRRYMKIGTPIAYEVYIPDFKFTFKDGQEFYFMWPMLLDDDARYVAHILEEKVDKIIDKYDVLYAMKNGINLSDHVKNNQITI